MIQQQVNLLFVGLKLLKITFDYVFYRFNIMDKGWSYSSKTGKSKQLV